MTKLCSRAHKVGSKRKQGRDLRASSSVFDGKLCRSVEACLQRPCSAGAAATPLACPTASPRETHRWAYVSRRVSARNIRWPTQRFVLALLTATVWGAQGCNGLIGGRGAAEGELGADVSTDSLGQLQARRLTNAELVLTLNDLWGLALQAEDLNLPEDDLVDGFDNQVGGANISQGRAEALMKLMRGIAADVTADPASLLSCPLAEGEEPDAACLEQSLQVLAKRAYRRPASAEELGLLKTVYDGSRAEGDTLSEGLALAIEAMLLAPQFLYRLEFGDPDRQSDRSGVVALSGYEVASRLSYLLWSTMPDEELFAAAESGEIDRVEGVVAQAERMLDHPKAGASIERFFLQWLDLHRLDPESPTGEKDAGEYPQYNEALRLAMVQETSALVKQVVLDEGGSLADLFLASRAYLTPALAEFYGLEAPTVVDEVEGDADGDVAVEPAGWVEFPPDYPRRGLLTHASFLAAHADSVYPSPTFRGLFVAERMLCRPPPPVPADVIDSVATGSTEPQTNRERFTLHMEAPECSGCHALFDPMGFPFEHYDAIGGYRSEDNGFPVDASGAFLSGDTQDGTVSDALELVERASRSDAVGDCLTEQWYRYAFGSKPPANEPLATAQGAFRDAGQQVRALILGLVQLPNFRFAAIEEVE